MTSYLVGTRWSLQCNLWSCKTLHKTSLEEPNCFHLWGSLPSGEERRFGIVKLLIQRRQRTFVYRCGTHGEEVRVQVNLTFLKLFQYHVNFKMSIIFIYNDKIFYFGSFYANPPITMEVYLLQQLNTYRFLISVYSDKKNITVKLEN